MSLVTRLLASSIPLRCPLFLPVGTVKSIQTLKDVFQDVGAGLVENALAGRVCCCFAYGQTGSGKTYTMAGLMQSMAGSLFDPTNHGSKYTISFSFFEILGVNTTDCLAEYTGPNGAEAVSVTKGSTNSTGVVIGEDLSGAIVLRNLTEHMVADIHEFQQLVEFAAAHRRTRSTERNATSSRSHAVATIRVHHAGFPAGAAPEPGVLRVIDLAGSERAADSGMLLGFEPWILPC
jgi:kinesin family protein 2/24